MVITSKIREGPNIKLKSLKVAKSKDEQANRLAAKKHFGN